MPGPSMEVEPAAGGCHRFGQIVVRGLVRVENGLRAPGVVERQQHVEAPVLLVCRIEMPWYLPDVAVTGSQPAKKGVITPSLPARNS
jgi:hypothetical protein